MKLGIVLLAPLLGLLVAPGLEAATITVAESDGEYSTVGEAMNAAQSGDTVLVKTGSYLESVLLKEGVTLKGEKADECIIIGVRAPAIVAEDLKSGRVKDLTLRAAGRLLSLLVADEQHDMVLVRNSKVTIEGCIVENGTASGIGLYGARSEVTVRKNICRKNRYWGIIVKEKASATIEENTCERNGYSGIGIYGRGLKPMVRANVCSRNVMNGIILRYGAAGRVENNTCEANGNSGIVLAAGTTPNVLFNLCKNNRDVGILVTNGASPRIERNTCEENKLGIVLQGKHTRPTVSLNLCRKNKQSGIVVHRQASGTIKDCIAEKNGFTGIVIFEAGAGLEVRGNSCWENRQGGIIFNGGSGLAQGNTCAKNGLSGIMISGKGASPEILENLSYKNDQSGIVAFDHATPKVSLNIVVANYRGINNGYIRDREDGKLVNLGYNCVWKNTFSNFSLCEPAGTDIQEDPKLVELDDGSYRLAKDSPCVGAGPNGQNIGGLAVVGERPETETETGPDR